MIKRLHKTCSCYLSNIVKMNHSSHNEKCIFEFMQCKNGLDCTSCKIAEDYWKSLRSNDNKRAYVERAVARQ